MALPGRVDEDETNDTNPGSFVKRLHNDMNGGMLVVYCTQIYGMMISITVTIIQFTFQSENAM